MDPQTPSVLTGRNSTKGIPASVKRTALSDFTQRLGRVYKPRGELPSTFSRPRTYLLHRKWPFCVSQDQPFPGPLQCDSTEIPDIWEVMKISKNIPFVVGLETVVQI